MECRKVLTNDNVDYVLFTLDAYGALEVGKFVLRGHTGGVKLVALTREGVERVVDKFDDFEAVDILFECDEELANAVKAQILRASAMPREA